MTNTALDVSKLFLYWANRDGDIITNLKMQKLLYYAQAWYLVNFKTLLFEDSIEAWAFGPVVRTVYGKYKKYGCRPITYADSKGAEEKIFTVRQLKFLEQFYSIYIKYSAHDLVNLSHNEAPWKEAYNSSEDIDTNRMKTFYSAQYKSLLQ